MHVMSRNSQDGSVTLDEFTEYYRNVSMIIDDDEHFLLVVNNCWNVNGGTDPYKKFSQGFKQEDSTARPVSRGVQSGSKDSFFREQKPIQRSGMTSSSNPLVTTSQHYAPTYNAARANTTSTSMHSGPPT